MIVFAPKTNVTVLLVSHTVTHQHRHTRNLDALTYAIVQTRPRRSAGVRSSTQRRRCGFHDMEDKLPRPRPRHFVTAEYGGVRAATRWELRGSSTCRKFAQSRCVRWRRCAFSIGPSEYKFKVHIQMKETGTHLEHGIECTGRAVDGPEEQPHAPASAR